MSDEIEELIEETLDAVGFGWVEACKYAARETLEHLLKDAHVVLQNTNILEVTQSGMLGPKTTELSTSKMVCIPLNAKRSIVKEPKRESVMSEDEKAAEAYATKVSMEYGSKEWANALEAFLAGRKSASASKLPTIAEARDALVQQMLKDHGNVTYDLLGTAKTIWDACIAELKKRGVEVPE